MKKYFLFFIFSCFSFFINAEQMKETFWGIPFGSDFSIVNDKMISKGFYLDENYTTKLENLYLLIDKS